MTTTATATATRKRASKRRPYPFVPSMATCEQWIYAIEQQSKIEAQFGPAPGPHEIRRRAAYRRFVEHYPAAFKALGRDGTAYFLSAMAYDDVFGMLAVVDALEEQGIIPDDRAIDQGPGDFMSRLIHQIARQIRDVWETPEGKRYRTARKRAKRPLPDAKGLPEARAIINDWLFNGPA